MEKRKKFKTSRNNMLSKLMLVVSELSEAAECVRDNNFEEDFAEELADAVIRIFDICGTLNIDLEHAITIKMIKNELRPIKHGRVSDS